MAVSGASNFRLGLCPRLRGGKSLRAGPIRVFRWVTILLAQVTRDGRGHLISISGCGSWPQRQWIAGASVGGQLWLVGNQRSSGEKMPKTMGHVSLRSFSTCDAADYLTKSLRRLLAPA
jgi:hypothetical protein